MWAPDSLAIVAATFVIAGFVKGVIGLGVPTVSLALLTATLGLMPAMALLLLPSLVTNLWQAIVGGAFVPIVRRLWPLLLAVCIGTWIGVRVLVDAETSLLSALLGGLLCIYAGLSLARPQVRVPGRAEGWLSPVVGGVNGLLTGLTGSFVVPGVLYLQALGLPRDVLVQAMGILFTVSTVALAVSLGGYRLIPPDLAALSAVAVAPALVGMQIGRMVRRRLSEAVFRRLFFAALFVMGAYIAARALV